MSANRAEVTASLFIAAERGDTDRVSALISSGADLNAKDKDGKPALMYAAGRKGSEDTLKAFIAAGADVSAKENNGGATVLMFAAVKGATEALNALIAAGADVNAQNNNGASALMFAAVGGTLEDIKALVAAGANVNAKDKTGWTALMFAAGRKGTAENVKTLIDLGADVHIKTKNGDTALMMAAKDGDTGSVEALIAAGAEEPGAKRVTQSAPLQEMFSRATLVASGRGSGDASADERLIGRIMKAFNYLYSTNVQPGDFSVKFGGRDDAHNSFVLMVKVPTPATIELGEEMTAALEELLRRNGLR